MAKILIVDDERVLVKGIKFNLEHEGYQCTQASDGAAALAAVAAGGIDLVILDVMMPFMDGMTCLKEMRLRGMDVPVIILTARGEEYDKLEGLGAGADDYVVKPFDSKEVVARIKAVLRRSGGPSESDILEAGGVRLSLSRGTVWASGRTAELTRNELKILAHLMAHAGEIVSRADLIEALWDSRIYIDDNTLSVNVTRLRNKLGELGLPEQIKTRRGMGYQYDDR